MIRKAVATLEDDLAADIEQALAEAAPHITQAQLADLAQVVKAAAAPEDAEAAAKKNHANQSLSISRTFDGMYRVDGWLDTEAGAEIAATIEALLRKRDPNLSPFEDPIGKRRAEALLQMARHATNHADHCNSKAPAPAAAAAGAVSSSPPPCKRCSPGSAPPTSKATAP